MLSKIKNKIDKELVNFIDYIDKVYSLKKLSPLLFKSIKDFALRKGKRVRPILLIIGYMGFKKKPARGLYTTALALELLHDFMLIHDDIIDKSDTRRGKPSLHKMMNDYLRGYKNIKFSGEDLSLIMGDIIYALSIHAFLAIDENMQRKEKALKKFIEAAIHTGSGELIELLNGLNDIKKITQKDIYKVYDFKTAYYTFASPLATGAILAGAKQSEVTKLFKYGLSLGRAFQIKDDILGMFSEEKETGKSSLTDLQEAKKTILIWHAYNNSDKKNKEIIEKIFSKKKVVQKDLLKTREIIKASGTLDFAFRETQKLIKEAQTALNSSKIFPKYKNYLNSYSQKILIL
ncbi:MAG: polyprenyl synthetase family protein [Candidatus Omnitrophota bacterium]